MYIISGTHRHKRLKTPKGTETRPTSSRLREALFNICQGFIENARFLDLFAGSGAMGLEALSRGASFATFIDQSLEAIRCIQHNINNLQVESQSQVLKGDIFRMLTILKKQSQPFDIIYVDPPYHSPSKELSVPYSVALIQWIDQNQLLASGGTLFIEEAYAYPPSLSDLTHLQLKNERRFGSTILQQYTSSH